MKDQLSLTNFKRSISDSQRHYFNLYLIKDVFSRFKVSFSKIFYRSFRIYPQDLIVETTIENNNFSVKKLISHLFSIIQWFKWFHCYSDPFLLLIKYTLEFENRTGSCALVVWLSCVVQHILWDDPHATLETLTPSSPWTRAGLRFTVVPAFPCCPWSLSPQANT